MSAEDMFIFEVVVVIVNYIPSMAGPKQHIWLGVGWVIDSHPSIRKLEMLAGKGGFGSEEYLQTVGGVDVDCC